MAGDVTAVHELLAVGADPNASVRHGYRALQAASEHGHPACVRALLAAGADPNLADDAGMTPLHRATIDSHVQCMAALLAAGADAAVASAAGWCALHSAAQRESADVFQLLLEAAPQAALLRDKSGQLPLDFALRYSRFHHARCLLEHAPLPPAGEVLAALEEALEEAGEDNPPLPLSLYAPLLARQRLTPAQWERVPSPSPGLGAVLPAVLARSEAEAAALVARLPADERERLRTAALCLRRAERVHGAELPPEIARSLLLVVLK